MKHYNCTFSFSLIVCGIEITKKKKLINPLECDTKAWRPHHWIIMSHHNKNHLPYVTPHNYMQIYSNKYHILLTECNSGTIKKLSIWSWYYDWAQKYDPLHLTIMTSSKLHSEWEVCRYYQMNLLYLWAQL